jgi:cell division transport system permease protein
VTRVKHAAAVALISCVPLVGVACEDDPAQTRRRDKEVRNLASQQQDVEVFMDVNANETDIGNVRAALRKSDGVHAFRFLSKHDAYEEFKRLFADQPDLIEATEPAALPASFRVVLAPGVEPATIQAAFEQLPGVAAVQAPET